MLALFNFRIFVSMTYRLLDVEMLLDQTRVTNQVRQYALVSSEQCYIVRQIDLEPSSVVQRIPYKQLKLIQAVPVSEKNSFFGIIGITFIHFQFLIIHFQIVVVSTLFLYIYT